jgi:hypothetical protein
MVVDALFEKCSSSGFSGGKISTGSIKHTGPIIVASHGGKFPPAAIRIPCQTFVKTSLGKWFQLHHLVR